MILLLSLSVDLSSITADFLLSSQLFLSLLNIREIQLHGKAHRALFQAQKPGEVPFREGKLNSWM